MTEQDKNEIEFIQSELRSIDIDSIRPLRNIAIGNGTEYDRIKLKELETQASVLRNQLDAILKRY